MEIKKVVSLGAAEVELLVNSGKLIRELSNGLADGSIDELSAETTNLLKAVKDVLHTALDIGEVNE
jgi:hypothetical protein